MKLVIVGDYVAGWGTSLGRSQIQAEMVVTVLIRYVTEGYDWMEC